MGSRRRDSQQQRRFAAPGYGRRRGLIRRLSIEATRAKRTGVIPHLWFAGRRAAGMQRERHGEPRRAFSG